ncbi:MAG: 1-acyl-sn-glycerol-3-phosphate acyltransferase [bacterium]|nr:1-acyl-sn-glycerol-3-phosphate acyltransferase [bacterium]
MIRDIKPLLYLYRVYQYLIYFPLLGLFTAFFGSMAVLMGLLFGPRIGAYSGIAWARFNAYITPMFVKVSGRENVDKKQSYVIIVNHQSQYDIFVVYGWLLVDFRWVMKIQLRKVPFLGYACYKVGHIFIDRSNRDAALASINAAKETLIDGISVVFFPEGKRSQDGNLIDFKKGAFKFALDIGLPLLPVTIVGSRNLLPGDSLALFPGKAKMIIHEPISTEGYTDDNMQELMDKAKASIQQGFEMEAVKN